MSHRHFLPLIKYNYGQEKWSRDKWLFSYQSIPISKERSTFTKCLLVKEWETWLLAPFLVSAVCVSVRCFLWISGRECTEQNKPCHPRSLCAARQRKDLFLSGMETVRELRSWRTRYTASRVSRWLSQLSSQPYEGVQELKACTCCWRKHDFVGARCLRVLVCNKKIIYSNHNNHEGSLDSSSSLLWGRTAT